ncbi:MAG: DUF1801 domain-containing protein [Gammaproteobacteria bacterium]|nr:DUF1801 domain-containing protein [Gammaproteobacteria bacterium]
MAGMKTKKNALSVSKFLNAIADDQRRKDCKAVTKLMRDITGEEPKMWGAAMVGFGSYHYKYASGREGDYFVSGFSPRKQALTIYIMSGFRSHASLLKKLGKHKTAKSCLYIKKLEDIDMRVLEQLITRSVKHMRDTYPQV